MTLTSMNHLYETVCHELITSHFEGNASRKCMDDGRWFVHPQRKFPWTNFSLCAKEESPADVINVMTLLIVENNVIKYLFIYLFYLIITS